MNGQAPLSLARTNLELKARCGDLAAARRACATLGARAAGVMEHLDTYFHVSRGRLKLREIDGERAELIWYQRPDTASERLSEYHRVPLADPQAMRAALGAALGIRREVAKRRELYLWQNVRIHLDEVSGLGTFIELEAVLSEDAPQEISRARLEELMRALGVRESELIGGSYADLAAS